MSGKSRSEWVGDWEVSGERGVDARGVGFSGKGKGE